MKVTDALPDGTSVFLDSAPLIYYVESVSPFFDIVSGIFQRIDDGKLTAVTSPITLAECLFAVALKANCDVFLTNDIRLARVTEITVRLLSQLT